MLNTPWSPDTPIPLPEYPRPQMMRPAWINLNGWWQYAIYPHPDAQPSEQTHPPSGSPLANGNILVPYPIESALSGVARALQPDECLVYQRRFAIPSEWKEKRLLLHFGAVDYFCQVWVNGKAMGCHRGGYLPFTHEITDACLMDGENELVVSVWDPTNQGLQERGKQTLKPRGIWYTAVSGIWQTVWLECVPQVSIASMKLTPDIDAETLHVQITLRGEAENLWLEAATELDGMIVATGQGGTDHVLKVDIPNPRLWQPDDPYLYPLRLRLGQDGQVIDEVDSYFAMRKFGLVRDPQGFLRFALNDQPLFLYGPLDQGYFPDGLYTPPNEAAMLLDIDYTWQIGCNLIRKHVKIEPLRWYYHCDRLGMIVWQDMPNGGMPDGDGVAFLALMFGFHRNDQRGLQRFGRAQPANQAEYRLELQNMIDTLYNCACTAAWVPFNESWGQFHANQVAQWVKSYDSTRLVDHASGWFDQGGGDFQSKHVYFKRLKRPKPDTHRAFVLSEFGGYSLKIPGHLWNPDKKFGYRFYPDSIALTAAYEQLLKEQLAPLIDQGLAAAIYTQTCDVEIEINGFLTYDRQVEKMDRARIQLAHEALYQRFANALQPSYHPSVYRLCAHYLRTIGEDPSSTSKRYSVWHFCDNEEDADELAWLVLAGRKRATASVLWAYQANEPLPQVGEYSVITNWAGEAQCIIRTNQVEVVPFNQVTAEHAAAEGEGDLSLAYWREVHWRVFSRELAASGKPASETMPVICEAFEVLFLPPLRQFEIAQP